MLVLGSEQGTTEFPLVWDGPKSEWKVNFFIFNLILIVGPNALKVMTEGRDTHRYYKKQSPSRSNSRRRKEL